jgi:hypothetical protein
MKWLDLSSEERDAALNTVSQQLDIDTPSVEKDWWVTVRRVKLFQPLNKFPIRLQVFA